jgi:hypothetical protein
MKIHLPKGGLKKKATLPAAGAPRAAVQGIVQDCSPLCVQLAAHN